MSAVSDLLAQANTAHEQYRANVPHMAASGGVLVTVSGDPTQAAQWMQTALNLRAQAHVADPQRTDLAWQTDPLHDALLDYYVEQMLRPAADVPVDLVTGLAALQPTETDAQRSARIEVALAAEAAAKAATVTAAPVTEGP